MRIHSSPEITEHLYDHCCELHQAVCLSLFYWSLFLGICLILWFAAFSSISSLCSSLCVGLYGLGATATSLGLEEVTLSRSFLCAPDVICLGRQSRRSVGTVVRAACACRRGRAQMPCREDGAGGTCRAQLQLGYCMCGTVP